MSNELKEKIKMHTRTKWLTVGILTGLLSAALAACGGATTLAPVAAVAPVTAEVAVSGSYEDVTKVDGSGYTTVDQSALSNVLDPIPAGELSPTEIEGILYMREEEKLAHDVYLTLYERWGLPIFQNIADSEATHMQAVKTLIDRYNLEDPAAGQDVGVFTNPTLQGLYDQLVEEGSQSLSSALRVGAAIEEIDILDLEERIAQTDRADIQMVYENLTKGSRNHLRSFVSTLEQQSGEIYQPQYLSQAAYDAIVAAPMERGGGGRHGGSQRPTGCCD
jgi:hypothetical protein